MPEPLPIDARHVIPADELDVSTARAGGPGGQHVNTTDTRVRLRWAFAASAVLPEPVKQRLAAQNPSWVTRDGDLVVTSDATRSQHANLEDVRERLVAAILRAFVVPRPRKKTKPTKGSQTRRLDEKKSRKGVKEGRGRVRE